MEKTLIQYLGLGAHRAASETLGGDDPLVRAKREADSISFYRSAYLAGEYSRDESSLKFVGKDGIENALTCEPV